MAGPFIHSGAWVTAVSANDSTQKEELGILRFEGAKLYRYVKGTAANITAGQACSYAADSSTSIITTAAASTATAQSVAGIAETAITSGSFGWLTVSGPATALVDTGARVHDCLTGATTAGALAAVNTIHGAVATTGANNALKTIMSLTTGVLTGSLVFVRCI